MTKAALNDPVDGLNQRSQQDLILSISRGLLEGVDDLLAGRVFKGAGIADADEIVAHDGTFAAESEAEADHSPEQALEDEKRHVKEVRKSKIQRVKTVLRGMPEWLGERADIIDQSSEAGMSDSSQEHRSGSDLDDSDGEKSSSDSDSFLTYGDQEIRDAVEDLNEEERMVQSGAAQKRVAALLKDLRTDERVDIIERVCAWYRRQYPWASKNVQNLAVQENSRDQMQDAFDEHLVVIREKISAREIQLLIKFREFIAKLRRLDRAQSEAEENVDDKAPLKLGFAGPKAARARGEDGPGQVTASHKRFLGFQQQIEEMKAQIATAQLDNDREEKQMKNSATATKSMDLLQIIASQQDEIVGLNTKAALTSQRIGVLQSCVNFVRAESKRRASASRTQNNHGIRDVNEVLGEVKKSVLREKVLERMSNDSTFCRAVWKGLEAKRAKSSLQRPGADGKELSPHALVKRHSFLDPLGEKKQRELEAECQALQSDILRLQALKDSGRVLEEVTHMVYGHGGARQAHSPARASPPGDPAGPSTICEGEHDGLGTAPTGPPTAVTGIAPRRGATLQEPGHGGIVALGATNGGGLAAGYVPGQPAALAAAAGGRGSLAALGIAAGPVAVGIYNAGTIAAVASGPGAEASVWGMAGPLGLAGFGMPPAAAVDHGGGAIAAAVTTRPGAVAAWQPSATAGWPTAMAAVAGQAHAQGIAVADVTKVVPAGELPAPHTVEVASRDAVVTGGAALDATAGTVAASHGVPSGEKPGATGSKAEPADASAKVSIVGGVETLAEAGTANDSRAAKKLAAKARHESAPASDAARGMHSGAATIQQLAAGNGLASAVAAASPIPGIESSSGPDAGRRPEAARLQSLQTESAGLRSEAQRLEARLAELQAQARARAHAVASATPGAQARPSAQAAAEGQLAPAMLLPSAGTPQATAAQAVRAASAGPAVLAAVVPTSTSVGPTPTAAPVPADAALPISPLAQAAPAKSEGKVEESHTKTVLQPVVPPSTRDPVVVAKQEEVLQLEGGNAELRQRLAELASRVSNAQQASLALQEVAVAAAAAAVDEGSPAHRGMGSAARAKPAEVQAAAASAQKQAAGERPTSHAQGAAQTASARVLPPAEEDGPGRALAPHRGEAGAAGAQGVSAARAEEGASSQSPGSRRKGASGRRPQVPESQGSERKTQEPEDEKGEVLYEQVQELQEMHREHLKLQQEIQLMEKQIKAAKGNEGAPDALVDMLKQHGESDKKDQKSKVNPDLLRELAKRQDELNKLRRSWWQSHAPASKASATAERKEASGQARGEGPGEAGVPSTRRFGPAHFFKAVQGALALRRPAEAGQAEGPGVRSGLPERRLVEEEQPEAGQEVQAGVPGCLGALADASAHRSRGGPGHPPEQDHAQLAEGRGASLGDAAQKSGHTIQMGLEQLDEVSAVAPGEQPLRKGLTSSLPVHRSGQGGHGAPAGPRGVSPAAAGLFVAPFAPAAGSHGAPADSQPPARSSGPGAAAASQAPPAAA